MAEVDYVKEFKIYKNLLELLKARRYMVTEEKEEMSFEQFRNTYEANPQLVSVFFKPNEEESNNGIAVSLNIRRHFEKPTKDFV